MDKNIKKNKFIFRIEYKILLFFMVTFLLYLIYSYFFSGKEDNPPTDFSVGRDITDQSSGRKSIAEAIQADRPIVFNPDQKPPPPDKKLVKEQLFSIQNDDKSIKEIDTATDSAAPTVWIYIRNDGSRKDDMAAKYCKILHKRGIKASTVVILDSDAKSRGRLIELGEQKCSDEYE